MVLRRAHELKPGDRVLQLHDDGHRYPAVGTDVHASEEGDVVDVLFDNGRGACFGRNEEVRLQQNKETNPEGSSDGD